MTFGMRSNGMNRFFTIIAALTLAWGVRAADYNPVTDGGYVYWALDPVDESLQFAYVMMAMYDGTDVGKVYLTVRDTDQTIIFDAVTIPKTQELAPVYSKLPTLPTDPEALRFMVELYSESGDVIGISQAATFYYLWGDDERYLYHDMSVSGTLSPFRFTASSPEPTSGILVLVGLGAMALKRRRGIVSRSFV